MSAAIPDYVEPFEGWRVWRVSSNGCDLRLLSLVQHTVWPPREELAAGCLQRRVLARLHRARPHQAPAEACACGIYATTLDRLGSYLHEPADGRTRFVFGRVCLWGTVVECEQGWRAARAYPAEIIVPTSSRGARHPAAIMASPHAPVAGVTAEELADALRHYAVPVIALPHTPAEALEVVAREHGRDDPIGSRR
jgi:hypothetical protein